MARQKTEKPIKNTDAPLGFEAELFLAADKLRKNLEPSDYKHVVLGMIFLRYISHAFEAQHAKLSQSEYPWEAEEKDPYTAEGIAWVPQEARWSFLQEKARVQNENIGQLIDGAMDAIEKENQELKGVLPKGYSRAALDRTMLSEVVDLISAKIKLEDSNGQARDLLGRIYEYFLGSFAGSEGKRGGEFYTPRSVVKLLVEMLEPFPNRKRGIEGRVYDPCCGSGGMFVQAERFVEEHGGRKGEVVLYGQESNHTTWRLCKMNLVVRQIDSEGIKWNNEGSFVKDEWPTIFFDFILANPPFNVSDWKSGVSDEDARWKYGIPPDGNANYAWLQHIVHHLAPNGTAGVVLANGSMSSNQSGEDAIRRALIEGGIVDCMVALPGQLFYSTQIPACLWFLARNRKNPGGGWRDRSNEILFIDARKMGRLVDRTRRELTEEDVALIARTYHAWRGQPGIETPYEDVPGFCRAATLEEVAANGHVLTPGRYVGAAETEADDTPFAERFGELQGRLLAQFDEGRRLEERVREQLGRIAPEE